MPPEKCPLATTGYHSPLPKKFYPLIKSTGTIDVRTISEELSDASTLNSVDIRAVLFGLEKSLLKYLQEGYNVKFGDLGTFTTSLSGTGAETAEEFTAGSVTKSASFSLRLRC